MSQVAVPVASVFAVQVSEPLRVNVTGSFEIGAPVSGLVNTAETGVGDEEVARDGQNGQRRRRGGRRRRR